MNRLIATVGLALAVVTLGAASAVALANGGGPPGGEPPGQGECEHGNSGQECKPDPQPDHGKDCDEHGNKGGVNEDHCLPTTPTETTPTQTTPTDTTPTTPTDTTPTTPTDTTPTTPTETTPTEPTPTEPTPTTPAPGRCPPGQGPYAGKDGEPGNQECCPDANDDHVCDSPPAETPVTAAATPPVATTAVAPTATTVPPAVTTASKPKPTVRLSTAKKHSEPAPKLTGNPKKDQCTDTGYGTMRCKGVVVVQGSG